MTKTRVVLGATLVAMGLAVLGVAQITPDIIFTDVTGFVSVRGVGGTSVYLCAPGVLPWNGGCLEQVTGNFNCDAWGKVFELEYGQVLCDGNPRTFETQTIWTAMNGSFKNYGSVTFAFTPPLDCQLTTNLKEVVKAQRPECRSTPTPTPSPTSTASPTPTISPSPTPADCEALYGPGYHWCVAYICYGSYCYWTTACCPPDYRCQVTFCWGPDTDIMNCCQGSGADEHCINCGIVNP